MTAQAVNETLRAKLGRGALYGALGGSLAAVLDGVVAVLSGFQGQRFGLILYSWALLVPLTTTASLCFVVWLHAVGRVWKAESSAVKSFGRRLGLWFLRSALLVLPLTLLVFWVPSSWVLSHWAELRSGGRALAVLSYVLMFVATVLAGAALHWLLQRCASGRPARFHALAAPAAALLALACYAADRVVLVGLYDEFHYGLFGGFLLGLSVAVVLMAARLWWQRPSLRAQEPKLAVAAVAATAVAFGLAVMFEFARPDVFGPSQALGFSKFVASGRALTDFDKDGVSALFGGSDCDGFDPRSVPGKFDLPGNGKDEDCSHGDAAWPKLRPKSDVAVPNLEGYDVVIFTVDALRADHLGAYGYARNTSPNIDALARRSLLFRRAFSAAPKTYDSLPALFTGLYPSNIPRDYEKKAKKPKSDFFDTRPYAYEITKDTPLLAERFQQQGYYTAACEGVSLLGRLGLNRGFERYSNTKDCMSVVEEAKDRPEPLFFWAHLYSPHEPYLHHAEFDFGNSAKDRYDSEIAHDDAEIAKLLKVIEQRGRADKTIIIISADHGEEFREHGGEFHGFRVYRELLHVPLLLSIPGMAPASIDTPVEVLGVTPALCELVRLKGSCDGYDAESLLTRLNRPEEKIGAYSELFRRGRGSVLRSLYDERWHLIIDLMQDRVELYDVTKDWNEQHNLAQLHPEIVAQMTEQLTLRPLYQAARLFEVYLVDKDPLVLAEGLPKLRHEELIQYALRELQAHPHKGTVKALERLAKRPGLRKDLQKQALDAAARGRKARAH